MAYLGADVAEDFGEVLGVGGGVVRHEGRVLLLGRRRGDWLRCAFHGGLRVGWAGESTVPSCVFNFFGILLQGKGEKVWGLVFFGGEGGIRSRVSGRDD